MVMKPLKKSALREIKKNAGRYLAILAIIALGVGFFCGLRICKPAMLRAGDAYIRESNLFDYRLISTLGFTQEDEAYFAALDGVNAAEGAVWADFLYVDAAGNNRALRAHSLTREINRPSIVAGRMPEKADELIADAQAFSEDALGTVVRLSDDNDQDTLDSFRYREYTIVGIANSAYYLNYERGNTNLGSGSLAGFVYLPCEGFDMDVYTVIFVDIDAPGEIYSQAYNDALAAFEDRLEAETEKRADLRYQNLVADAQEEIAEAQSELDTEYADYQSEKTDAVSELNDARDELDEAERQIADGEAELSENAQKLEDARSEYKSGRRAYYDAVDEFEAQRAESLSGPQGQYDQLTAQRSELEAGVSAAEAARDAAVSALQAQVDTLNGQISGWEGELSALDETVPEQAAQAEVLRGQISAAQGEVAGLQGQIAAAQGDCDAQTAELRAQIDALQPNIDALSAQISAANAEFDAQRAALDAQLSELQNGIAQIEQSGVLEQYQQAQSALSALDAAQTELDAQSAAAQAELEGYQKQLDSASSRLSRAKRQIADGEAQLEQGYADLASAREELEAGKVDYESAFIEAQDQFNEADLEFTDAQAEIDDAHAEVAEIEPATLYALSRKTNVGYVCFENDSQIVQGVSTVFPLFFFLVAALVCMTTMTRMVDEQRTEIGTLKALGYGRASIMSKYLFYSGSAALIGALIGFFGGSYLFPKVIWMAYDMMYGFAPIPYVLSIEMGALSLGAALLCSMGATWFSCNVELAEAPAQLIRPKAPKAGKRVLLERVGFIWKRLSFLRKVTLRNVFRYKKRLLMMVMGIGGCTALLVTGFGINDSIANLGDDQYGSIMVYDLSATFTDGQDAQAQRDFVSVLGDQAEGARFVHQSSAEVAYGDQTRQLNLIAADGALDGFIELHDGETALAFPAAGECSVSRGLAERCGFSVGDRVTLYDGQMARMELNIASIFDNYIDNYLIAGAESVPESWGDMSPNTALINCAPDADAHALSAAVSEMEGVSNGGVTLDTRARFDNTLSSLNYIVILVVICAAALAFIVLYNLTNINICERIREIATVKVLGFTLRETSSYALSENLFLSAIGAIVGLPLGRALHAFVMAQIQVDLVRFDVRILPMSYLISIALTMVFAGLVNLFMLRRIDRINMAESLKTIE